MEIILGKTSGFCFGVKNAIDQAEKELEINNNVYCLGEIVHNEEVIKNLEQKGLIIIDDIEKAKDKVIIRSHGVPKEVYEKAKIKNIEILDFTCPFVSKIHKTVSKYSNNGYFIFLLGNKVHPETIGTVSFCGKNFYLIETLDDIDNAIYSLEKSSIKNLLIISQTTFSVSLFENIVEMIKSKINNNITCKIENTICNTTFTRQKETEEISKNVDLMIVIGGKHSSNTKKLFEISKQNCKNCLLIQTKNDLNYEDLKNYNRIGIIAGASTPKNIIDDVKIFCEN